MNTTTTFTRLAAGTFVSALVLTAGVAVGAGAATDTPARHYYVTGPGQEVVQRPQVLLGTGAGAASGGGGGAGSVHRTVE